jgi:hypothetical protein
MGAGKFKFVIWHADGTKKSLDTADAYTKLEEMRLKYGWSYAIWGTEVAPTPKEGSDGVHIDGYYEMPNPRKEDTERKKFVKYLKDGWGSVKLAKGTAGENTDYSSKDDCNVVEHGTPAAQGVRKDLVAAKNSILKGELSTVQILQEDPEMYHMYGRTLDKIEDLRMQQVYRTEMTLAEWIWGSTGTGKSHYVFEGFTPETHYVWKDDKGWQDGYRQQETVIINDFRGKIPYNDLLQMIDKWPYDVSRRGRPPMPFTSKRVLITSSLPPDQVYKNREEEDKLDQLLRRIKVTELKAPYEPYVE